MLTNKTDGGHAEFVFKVFYPPANISFHIIDRYSSMRAFQSMLRKNVEERVFKDLPPFPKKKLIGGMDAAFLN